jgi:hypothetical protein
MITRSFPHYATSFLPIIIDSCINHSNTNTMTATVDILTVRLIKSFEYRTFKNLLMRDVDTSLTVAEFKERIKQGMSSTFSSIIQQLTRMLAMKTTSGMKPFLNVPYGKSIYGLFYV